MPAKFGWRTAWSSNFEALGHEVCRVSAAQADLIVIGAGPAGVSAAVAASECGLKVVLLDEQRAAGGQVYRAASSRIGEPTGDKVGDAKDQDARNGDALRQKLAGSAVQHLSTTRIWSVTRNDLRFQVDAFGEDGPLTFEATQLVAATGAYERVVPFPGWTLPGVIGLAAATVLLKSEQMIIGRRVVVAGCGPLLAAVAAKTLQRGAEFVAIVDLSAKSKWISTLPRIATRPELLRQGLSWATEILRHRVQVYSGHAIRSADGSDHVERVVLGPVGPDGAAQPGAEVEIDNIDALIVGHGLVPGAEITRLLGANHHFDRLRGGWVPTCDAMGRSSVPGLIAVGDGAGIRGAIPAILAGELAGLAAATDAKRAPPDDVSDRVERAAKNLRRSNAFSDGIADFLALKPAMVRDIADETIVCRCEDIPRHEIDAAIQAGAHEMNQLKHFTRCGMGPCQGRMCGDVVGELLAQHVGSREAAGYWTQRTPLRPVPLSDLIGDYTYADVPIPAPAPL
ncbi:MAG: FAD-dependent oxidoreductase [Hyphomicrobiaceae bacterium]